MSNISVVQPATFDARAVRPRLAINLALGLLFALAAAVGVAVLCERLDSSWKSAREGEQILAVSLDPAPLTRNGQGLTP